MLFKSVSNSVASNSEESCAEAVGSNNDNIANIEIIDFRSEQVKSNTQFLLNTGENIFFNINYFSTRDVDTEMADLSSTQVEKYTLVSPYDTGYKEITGDLTYMGKKKYVHDDV